MATPVERVLPHADFPAFFGAAQCIEITQTAHCHLLLCHGGSTRQHQKRDGVGFGFRDIAFECIEIQVAHEMRGDFPVARLLGLEDKKVIHQRVKAAHQRAVIKLGDDVFGEAAAHLAGVALINALIITIEHVVYGGAVEQHPQVVGVL